ncbi:MAG: 2-C-methyl-D-erythritol 2,4-cyclodiphosphate synthase [Patescibacteria group bacterium]|nr:2-C-methyl-D-erythritol 2,4-cyclodiphosphate synthase [Patescibacteria group bacterium]
MFEGDVPLQGNSDTDAVLHSITNAISGITGVNIMGKIADEMCQKGITDSAEYLKEALRHFGNARIIHVSCIGNSKLNKKRVEIQEPRSISLKIVKRRQSWLVNFSQN